MCFGRASRHLSQTPSKLPPKGGDEKMVLSIPGSSAHFCIHSPSGAIWSIRVGRVCFAAGRKEKIKLGKSDFFSFLAGTRSDRSITALFSNVVKAPPREEAIFQYSTAQCTLFSIHSPWGHLEHQGGQGFVLRRGRKKPPKRGKSERNGSCLRPLLAFFLFGSVGARFRVSPAGDDKFQWFPFSFFRHVVFFFFFILM